MAEYQSTFKGAEIDDAVAKARSTQQMITYCESSTTATRNYAIGDLVIVGNVLYKVTAAIATGETISSSNTDATDVASELASGSGGGVDESALTSVEPWYEGTDLTTKFADEITSYGGNPWAWIKARITAGNFSGIHVNDYIPFTTTNGYSFTARVAGINPYRHFGQAGFARHIDFITREAYPVAHHMNPANFNNGYNPKENITGDGTTTAFVLTKHMINVSTVKQGTSTLTGWTYDPSTYTLTFESAPSDGAVITVTGTGNNQPWLASDLYLWLNSLAGQVPNGTEYNPELLRVDYTQGGVYYYLPDSLKNVITGKSAYVPVRSTTSLLNDENSSTLQVTSGKLWLPTEYEVCGTAIYGSVRPCGDYIQYPIFRTAMDRIKWDGTVRRSWWLMSGQSGNTTKWCSIANTGRMSPSLASSELYAPICFRIMQ